MARIPVLLSLFCVVVIIVGCAVSSPVQQYSNSRSEFDDPPVLIDNDYPDEDIFRIYHRAATGFVSIQSIRQSAEQRAEDFASRQGKNLLILGEQISNPPYILGNFPRIEIVFALIDKTMDESPAPERDRYSELEKLKRLLDDGALSQEEYDTEKAKILSE